MAATAAEAQSPHLIGVGLYTFPEAARLVGSDSRSLHRWVEGYRYASRGRKRAAEPLWGRGPLQVGETKGMSFLDLIEARFVLALRAHEITWPAIRRAARVAREVVGESHPFATHRLLTDGKEIFLETEDEIRDARLLNLIRSQFAFRRIVGPMLKDLEFEEGIARRWYPTPNRKMVLDPERAFGRPIIEEVGVPTAILAEAARAEGSPSAAARWFDVPVQAVRAAVAFEARA